MRQVLKGCTCAALLWNVLAVLLSCLVLCACRRSGSAQRSKLSRRLDPANPNQGDTKCPTSPCPNSSKGGCQIQTCRCLMNDALAQVAWVPGSFELPLVAKAMAKSGKYDAVITVGAVVCSVCFVTVPSKSRPFRRAYSAPDSVHNVTAERGWPQFTALQ